MTDMVLLLCSGGLDSTTLAYWLRARQKAIWPLFFDYGQHCANTEWETLQNVLPKEGVRPPERVDISGLFQGSQSRMLKEPDLWNDFVEDADLYIPYRTLLFFSAGAACAQSRGLDEVYAAFINSNHAKEIDCSATFLNGLDRLAPQVGAVRFVLPFRDWSKSDVVAEAERLRVPIGRTYSCQLLSDIPCGACPNCVERLNALAHTE